jgi:hypothetical protein
MLLTGKMVDVITVFALTGRYEGKNNSMFYPSLPPTQK